MKASIREDTFSIILHLFKWYGPTNHSPYFSCTFKESIAQLESSLFHFLHQASANSFKNSKKKNHANEGTIKDDNNNKCKLNE